MAAPLPPADREEAGMPLGDRLRALMRSRNPLAAVALVLGLLIVVAATTPEGLALLSAEEPRRIVVPDTPILFRFLIGAIAVMVLAAYVWLRVKALQDAPGARRRSSLVSLLLLLLLVAALFSTFPSLREWAGDAFRVVGVDAPEPDPTTDPTPTRPVRRDSSRLFGTVLTALLLTVVIAALVVWVMIVRRERVEPPDDEIDRGLLDAVDAGIDDLESIADPREAVIACYARMQIAATRVGVARRPSDTPFELLRKLLDRHDVGGSAHALTVLFERAKFSTQDIDENMRRSALAALSDVRDSLGALR